jgi:hypothetical protein
VSPGRAANASTARPTRACVTSARAPLSRASTRATASLSGASIWLRFTPNRSGGCGADPAEDVTAANAAGSSAVENRRHGAATGALKRGALKRDRDIKLAIFGRWTTN